MRFFDDIAGWFVHPRLALDFRAESIGLYRRDEAGWSQLAAAPLDRPSFQEDIAALAQKADASGLGRRVELWLPSDQILNRRMTLEGSSLINRRARTAAILSEEAGVSAKDIAFDIAASPSGVWSVTAADREVVAEAARYARIWGFSPTRVTTRHGDKAFTVGPELWSNRRRGAAIGVGAAGLTAAASLTLILAGPIAPTTETATIADSSPMKVALAPKGVAPPVTARAAGPADWPSPLWPAAFTPPSDGLTAPLQAAPIAAPAATAADAQPQLSAPKSSTPTMFEADPSFRHLPDQAAQFEVAALADPVVFLTRGETPGIIGDALASPAEGATPGPLTEGFAGEETTAETGPAPVFAGLSFTLTPGAPGRTRAPRVEDWSPSEDAAPAPTGDALTLLAAPSSGEDAAPKPQLMMASLAPFKTTPSIAADFGAVAAMTPAVMAPAPGEPARVIRVAEVVFAPARDGDAEGQAKVRVQGVVPEGEIDLTAPAPAPRPRTVAKEDAPATEAPPEAETEVAAEETAEKPGPGAVARAPSPGRRPAKIVAAAKEPEPEPTPEPAAASEEQFTLAALAPTTPRPKARPKSIRAKNVAIAATGARSVKAPARSVSSSRGVSRVATLKDVLPYGETSLLGVFGKSDKRRALVRLPDGEVRRVKKGAVIDGWVIAKINATSMRMTRGGQTRSLPLVR